MAVAGVMSGTSADGVDVAFVRITGAPSAPRLVFRAHASIPYPKQLRSAILASMNAGSISVAGLSRLHWRLGAFYAEAIEIALDRHPAKLDLIGCHGQTIYHQGRREPYLGARTACTWQIGEASVIAARLGTPVVSDFRPADLAAGGQAAPLVPYLDFVAFRHLKRARVLQNLGGIGNLTVIPARATANDILAFDTGPANMVIDALMEQLFHRPYDKGGRVAAEGRVLERPLRQLLRNPYFRLAPPKSAGREEFGREYAAELLDVVRTAGGTDADAVTTATALTAHSIRIAWERFVQPHLGRDPIDYILAGGGTENPTLLAMIGEQLAPFGCTISIIDAHGIPSQAKEAVAFALLAWRTWHRLPGNLPAATGAAQAAILGRITHV